MADSKNEGHDKKASDDPRYPFGRGMTSPDSTQVPLSAETGEPDEEAIRGRAGQGADADDASDAGSSGGRH